MQNEHAPPVDGLVQKLSQVNIQDTSQVDKATTEFMKFQFGLIFNLVLKMEKNLTIGTV